MGCLGSGDQDSFPLFLGRSQLLCSVIYSYASVFLFFKRIHSFMLSFFPFIHSFIQAIKTYL